MKNSCTAEENATRIYTRPPFQFQMEMDLIWRLRLALKRPKNNTANVNSSVIEFFAKGRPVIQVKCILHVNSEICRLLQVSGDAGGRKNSYFSCAASDIKRAVRISGGEPDLLFARGRKLLSESKDSAMSTGSKSGYVWEFKNSLSSGFYGPPHFTHLRLSVS